jgi:hypothetical protein
MSREQAEHEAETEQVGLAACGGRDVGGLWQWGRSHNHYVQHNVGGGDDDQRCRHHDVRSGHDHFNCHDDYHGPRHNDHRGTNDNPGFVPTGT